MTIAVQFYREAERRAIEVENILADAVLASKLLPAYLSSTKP